MTDTYDLQDAVNNIIREAERRGAETVSLTLDELRNLANPEEVGFKAAFDIDEGIQMLKEANAAWGNYTATEPGVPEVDEVDKLYLKAFAAKLAALAAELKASAAMANETGRKMMGVLLIRLQLSVEETGEFAEALALGDLQKASRELLDMSYVTDGHYLTLGIADLKVPLYRELHRANMSKLVDGKPQISVAGRHMKGPDYTPPDFSAILPAK